MLNLLSYLFSDPTHALATIGVIMSLISLAIIWSLENIYNDSDDDMEFDIEE